MSVRAARHKVLIIEDSRVDSRLLTQILSVQGYDVVTASDGASGLSMGESETPDLILLDIGLPDLDGYEVCRQLKSNPSTYGIPVIFISSLTDAEWKMKAFAAGGVDFVTKPFQPREVLARVHTHLSLHEMQRQLEATNLELGARLEELERRNEELDAFAHTVAHDLKNPLQVILGLAELLTEDLASQVNPPAIEMLNTIYRIGHKMGGIIDELFLLSSLRQQEVQITELDMGGIVEEALDTLAAFISDRNAQIAVPKRWPVAMGYASWVEEVWVNYISNALKYGGNPPVIELGSTHMPDGMIRFWVRDNGAGIAPENQSRLFLPMARVGPLHVEGHGLGLSIVRRIVTKLGGTVGVESAPGQGSTFSFVLPAACLDGLDQRGRADTGS